MTIPVKLADLNLRSFGNTIPMVGAIYAGEGRTFLAYFPDSTHEHNPEPLHMNPGEWEAFLRQTDSMETEILKKAADGAVVKAIARKCERNISQVVSWKVFKRDLFSCRYCSDDDIPLTVDHLVLWEEGGPSIEANLLASCRRCNKTRGNTQYADWLKHPYYRRVSEKLSERTREANQELVATLDKIPRLVYPRSR